MSFSAAPQTDSERLHDDDTEQHSAPRAMGRGGRLAPLGDGFDERLAGREAVAPTAGHSL